MTIRIEGDHPLAVLEGHNAELALLVHAHQRHSMDTCSVSTSVSGQVFSRPLLLFTAVKE